MTQKNLSEMESLASYNLMNKISITPLFAKIVYFSILEDLDLTKINKLVKKIGFTKAGEKNDRDDANIVNISLDTHILNNKSFKFLKKIVEKEFNTYKNNVLQYHNTDFKITTSWIIKSEPNQSSNYHNHSNCMYSGILYLTTPLNGGGISFLNYFDKETIKIIPTQYNLHNSTEFTFNPTAKTICFFPADIHHKILPNHSNEARLSLAFNLFPSGQLGRKGSDSFVNVKVKEHEKA